MEYQDDRTPNEKKTHNWIVAATDSFLSGWGKAKGGSSYFGWACKYKNLDQVENWVRSRGDMKRVRIVGPSWRPIGKGHTHIYVVDDKHNALQ